MPGKNLTRDEARERASGVEVHAYAVELDLTGPTSETGGTFRSTTVVQFSALGDGASDTAGPTFIDLLAPTVRDVTRCE